MTTASEKDTSNGAANDAADPAGQERPFVTIRAIERGGDLQATNAIIGGAIGERVAVSRGFVRHAYSGRSLELRQAGAGLVATAGGATIERAGAQAIVSAGSITMHQAGSGLALARGVDVERGGLVVLAITPSLQIHDGGRVLLGPPAAFAALAGVAALVVGLIAAARSRRARAT